MSNVNVQELERERRIEREKAEGGPDPRIVEMEALGAQVAPRGTCVAESGGWCFTIRHLEGRRSWMRGRENCFDLTTRWFRK